MPGGPRIQRKRLIEQFGNACQRCGYDRCYKALHFHHKDSSEKQRYSNGKGRASLHEIREHPERFILICSNCHAELHHETAKANYIFTNCEHCGKEFQTQAHRLRTGHDKYCSRDCVSAARDEYALSFKSIETRFWRSVEKTDTCWNWKLKMSGNTPVLQIKQPSGKYTMRSAVRISYEMHFGKIVTNHSIIRTCGNPRCVNPDHLHLRK